jgi:hypothetical protein
MGTPLSLLVHPSDREKLPKRPLLFGKQESPVQCQLDRKSVWTDGRDYIGMCVSVREKSGVPLGG